MAQVEAGLSSIGLQFDSANRHLFRWYIKNGTNPRWGGDYAWLLQRAQELDWFITNRTDYTNHRSALPTVVNIMQNCLHDEIARNIAIRAWMACNAEADMNTLPTLVRQRRTRLTVTEGTSVFGVNSSRHRTAFGDICAMLRVALDALSINKLSTLLPHVYRFQSQIYSIRSAGWLSRSYIDVIK
jgi:hypothetical protein